MESSPISITEALSPAHKQIFKTVGMRVEAAESTVGGSRIGRAVSKFKPDQWLGMTAHTYSDLEKLASDVHQDTLNIRADRHDLNEGITAMDVDFNGLVKHIKVMQYAVEDMWEKGLKSIFPEGTSVNYAKWLCILHDFYRFANINGPLPLDYVDRVSDKRVERLFPNSPASEHLHSMGMITGTSTLPAETNPAPFIFKLLDTTGKPDPRFPDQFFVENGPYDEWIAKQVQKGSLPFSTPIRRIDRTEPTTFHTVTPEAYKESDVTLTQMGLKHLERVIPGINYNEVLANAAGRVASDPKIVENFGKGERVIARFKRAA